MFRRRTYILAALFVLVALAGLAWFAFTRPSFIAACDQIRGNMTRAEVEDIMAAFPKTPHSNEFIVTSQVWTAYVAEPKTGDGANRAHLEYVLWRRGQDFIAVGFNDRGRAGQIIVGRGPENWWEKVKAWVRDALRR